MRQLQTHHNIGALSLLLGLSFLLESYSGARALLAPFSLVEWVPRLTGQHVWGIMLVGLGLLVLLSWSIYVRAASLILGTALWSTLAVCSLYEALLSPRADVSSCFAGLLSLSIVVAFLRASTRITDDFDPKHRTTGFAPGS